MSTTQQPQSLVEAIRHFSDPDVCTEFVAKLRWPEGPFCPRCGCVDYSYLSTRKVWKCKGCKKQYSVKLGTIFESSPLGLDKWLPAVWLVANSKNGISSHELGRSLGVTQKSAWFMLHRIRLAMQTRSFLRLSGEVEIDETYIGGNPANRHGSTRNPLDKNGWMANKTTVLGMRERGGDVRAEVVPDARRVSLEPRVRENVEEGSTVYTDGLRSYQTLGGSYDHEVIDHTEEYVRGRVHTNGIENFWSLLKRGLRGTYVSVEPKHLFRYVDERVFTYNLRNCTDAQRFEAVLATTVDRRLTFAEVTAK